MDPKLLKNIIKSRNEIRKKYKAIKMGKIDNEILLEETFKPISKPLKEFKEKSKEEISKQVNSKIKNELVAFSQQNKDNDDNNLYETPTKDNFHFNSPSHFTDTTFQTPENTILSRQPLDLESTPNEKSFDSNQSLFDDKVSIPSFYTRAHVKNTDLDQAYGPKFNKKEQKFEMGRYEINFEENSIKVGDMIYPATQGLYELIFMKKPALYNTDDLNNYTDILFKTNVFRKDVYNEQSQIKGNNGSKYKLISKLIKEKHGSGLMLVNNEKPNYVYWDDPNELIDRLRLLIASQHAGHSNHDNEIISIIEELREANIIL